LRCAPYGGDFRCTPRSRSAVCRSSSACYKSEVDGKTTDALEVAENACPDQDAYGGDKKYRRRCAVPDRGDWFRRQDGAAVVDAPRQTVSADAIGFRA